jgi:hypothetical protein
LSQALGYLRPGGCIVVSLPNVRHVSVFWAIFVRGRFPQRDRGIFDRTHLRWFTVADAVDLFSANGLRLTTINLGLRWGDRGGGAMNRLLNRLPAAVQRWAPIREFLAYQVCLAAQLPS